jgi:hypothetical protein
MIRLLLRLGIVLAVLVVSGVMSSARLATTAVPDCSVSPALPAPPTDRPKYVLRVRLNRGLREASGTLALSFQPEVATDRVVLRLWPNSPMYAARGARLTVGRVTSAGRTIPKVLGDATTLVVQRALAAGERVSLSMTWKLALPRGAGTQLRGGRSARLVSFFPLLAWDGAGWATDPPVRRLDSFWSTSPTADFDVRVVAPRGLRVLATGEEIHAGRWRARGVRDFALAVGHFNVRRTTVRVPGRVRVLVGFERRSSQLIQPFVSETVRALRWYSQRYGPYPWPTYTIAVMSDFIGFAGFAYPTFGFLGDASLALVPHETAHQWFYSLVGNDQSRDPWLSEGLATWAQTGPQQSLATFLATPIPADVRDRIGEPMSFWDPLGFEKLRLGAYVQPVQALASLGDVATVDCALRLFVVRNAYRTAVPRDLLAGLQTFFPDAEQKLRARGARF